MKHKTNTTRTKQIIYGTICAILLIAVVAAAFVYWHARHTPAPTVATNQGHATADKHVPSGTNKPSGPTSGGDSSKSGGGTGSATLDPSTQPAAPSGQFVSNHAPRLSGGTIYSTETSTCITTPGAYCQIKFQMGSTVKTLPEKLTDTNGSAVWSNWTLRDIGLSAGTWSITAVASNGSHSTATKDTIQLTVGP